ncbi:MAG TPA: hypothetical protein VI485_03970 [Vicinamibacterales bacterium]|nr:hypothetical protein [Vicinamibacterales bacterium]
MLKEIPTEPRPAIHTSQVTSPSGEALTNEPFEMKVAFRFNLSDMPGERASRTQPFPTKPPAFDRQGITEDDLIDFTPELRAEALAIARTYVLAPMFTPGSLPEPGPDGKQGTIQMPGTVGGADWTGAAFDPETGRLYVPSMTGPIGQNVMPGNPESSNLSPLM